MSFKHKLSRRLAMLFGVVVVAVIACEIPARTTSPTPTVAALIISPEAVAVQPNHDVALMAVGLMTSGDTAQIIVTWGASGGTIGNYSDNGGLHYAHYSNANAGTFKVWATSDPGGKSDTATITVSPSAPEPVASVTVSPATVSILSGQTVQLTATPEDANGSPLTGRVVTWASSAPGVASVSGSGLVTGVAAGTVTITATSEGKNGTATVTVTVVPVASVAVSPASSSLIIGQTAQLSVTTRDSAGNVLTGRTITWASSSTTVATVSASGLVTAKAAGSATITATSEGKSGTASVTVTVPPVATVTVSPASASVAVGQTVQLTATPKDAGGNVLTGRVVTWATSNAAVATVSSSGLVSGLVVGTATISATSEGKSGSAAITVTAPLSGTPDPTLLPVATTAQGPLTAAYDALNVPGLAAGSWYLDPTTGVKIYKLTSATFPTSASSWYHDYAEGGDEVSLPYNGNTRAVLVNGNGYWLVDFTPGVGVGNARRLTGSVAPCADMAFTFSSNPATPYYAYVSNCSSVQRIDIRTMTAAPGNGWPVNNETNAGWLHQSEGDVFFTWLRGTVVVGYEPSTGTLKTRTVANVDQPQINRNSSVRQVAINTQPQEGLLLWDFTQNAIICTAPGSAGGGPQFNHMGALRDRWIGLNWNTPAPHNYHQYLPDCSTQNLGSPASANDYYANGSWNQHPASLDDQWALFSTQGGLVPPGSGYLAPGGMIYVTASGKHRLLGHPYDTSTNYWGLSFVKQSSDGRYVMFISDMNGSPRTDVFLVVVPVR
jgi:uncharacterized protein YjdB